METNVEVLAQEAYDAWCRAARRTGVWRIGYKRMMAWSEIGPDRQACWRDAVEKVLDLTAAGVRA